MLDVSARSLSELKEDLRSLNWSAVVPLRVWRDDRFWKLGWVRWLAFLAFFPLALSKFFSRDVSLDDAAWALGAYFALLWCLILYRCLQPGTVDLGKIVFSAGFTVVVGMTLLLAAQKLPGIKHLYAATEVPDPLPRIIGYVLGVGVLEETTKVLPLYWLFIHRKNPTTVRRTAFLGCISGLAFGVDEAVMYSLGYAADVSGGRFGFGRYLVVQILRLISLPLLHALWAGVTGYFVGLAATFPARARALIVVGVGGVAVLHGFYDVFSSGWIGVALGVLSLMLFLGYARSTDYVTANFEPKSGS